MLKNKRGAVNFKKILLVSLSVLLVTLMVVTTALSQGIGVGLVSFSGVIETISGDLKYIVINETKIISLSTQIIDESGNAIKSDVLKPQFSVEAQVVQMRDGFHAKKIVIKKRKAF
jgi:hypothetical protein